MQYISKCIYLHAFGWCFCLSWHCIQGTCIISDLAFPEIRAHDLGFASAVLYCFSYSKAMQYSLPISFDCVHIQNWEKGCNETFIWCTCSPPLTFHWFRAAHLLTLATKPSLLIHHSLVLVSDYTVIQTINQLFLDSG